jgi:hypothetical protein
MGNIFAAGPTPEPLVARIRNNKNCICGCFAAVKNYFQGKEYTL